MELKRDLSTLKQAKKLFIDTGKLNRRIVNDEISYSWYRSKVLEIDHKGKSFKSDEKISGKDIEFAKRIKLENNSLDSYNKLYNIYLCNHKGIITEYLSERFKFERFSTNTFSDQIIGTNGIAQSIKKESNETVLGSEHYIDELDEFFTYGSPIVIDENIVCYVGIIGYADDYDNEKVTKIIQSISNPSSIQYSGEDELFSNDLPNFFYGTSPSSIKLKEEVDKLTKSNLDFLIRGSKGNGKELLARHIHENSENGNYPFLVLDPSSMIDELFREKFYSAINKPGTIYIENFEQINCEMEFEVIRYYDEKYKEGTSKDRPRIIYSTTSHSNLGVDKQFFYHQFSKRILNTEIEIKDWSERGNDLYECTDEIFRNISKNRFIRVDDNLKEKICFDHLEHSYRELYDRILLTVNNSKETSVLTLNSYIPKMKQLGDISLKSLVEVEREHIKSILEFCDNNMLQASKILGIGRSTLYRKVKEYDL